MATIGVKICSHLVSNVVMLRFEEMETFVHCGGNEVSVLVLQYEIVPQNVKYMVVP